MRASIITPVFNGVRFIEACIENVAAQGDVVLEHLIVDGGSTDGTVELVECLREKYSHVRMIPGPDQGQSDAMNKGTEASSGEVIGLLNADDYYEPCAVQEAVNILSKRNQPTLVVGTCLIIDTFHGIKIWNSPKKLTLEYLLQNSPRYPAPANPSAYFYHRAVHQIVGGYDVNDRYAMDLEFLLSCAGRVACEFVPRHWGNFRLIEGCKTYENIANGPSLVTARIEHHRQFLNRRQRSRMAAVRAVDFVRSKAANLIHGVVGRYRLLVRNKKAK